MKANPKLTVAALATFFAVAVPVMHAQAISPASLVQDGDTVGVHAFKNYAVWQSPLPPRSARGSLLRAPRTMASP